MALIGGLSIAMGAIAPLPISAGVPPPESVAVRTCREDASWVRPTPDQMAATVWQDRRYVDGSTGSVYPTELAYYTHHFVVFTSVTASGASHALDLTGLITAWRSAPGDLCGAEYDDALLTGQEVALWVFGYSVLAASRGPASLTVTVQPNVSVDLGYSIVQIPRPLGEHWSLRLVLPDGTDVAGATSPPIVALASEPLYSPPPESPSLPGS
ncbi:MAG TPA: hypothetical protein VK821_11595 [Dehalococcoidia bacterium]|nr:hypothetical protein [Dehalococcoidia bacterium]